MAQRHLTSYLCRKFTCIAADDAPTPAEAITCVSQGQAGLYDRERVELAKVRDGGSDGGMAGEREREGKGEGYREREREQKERPREKQTDTVGPKIIADPEKCFQELISQK